jgi:hypothetical protein
MGSTRDSSPDSRWASGSLGPSFPTPLLPQRSSRIGLAIYQTPLQSVAPPLLGGGDAIWTVQNLVRDEDVTATMICSRVLSRGSAPVRSPADRLLTSAATPKEIDCTILQPNAKTLTPPTIGRAEYIPPLPAHPQNSDEGNRLQHLAALKEIDRSV